MARRKRQTGPTMAKYIEKPNFGDAELTGLEFDHPSVSLKIDLVLPSGRHPCVVRIDHCHLLWMETDHMQNVIDDVIICASSAGLPSAVSSELRLRIDERARSHKIQIVCLVGLVGIELVAVGDDVSILAVGGQGRG